MPVAHALPQGVIFDLTAEQYARDWALPQFYFHIMTAYFIPAGAGYRTGKGGLCDPHVLLPAHRNPIFKIANA